MSEDIFSVADLVLLARATRNSAVDWFLSPDTGDLGGMSRDKVLTLDAKASLPTRAYRISLRAAFAGWNLRLARDVCGSDLDTSREVWSYQYSLYANSVAAIGGSSTDGQICALFQNSIGNEATHAALVDLFAVALTNAKPWESFGEPSHETLRQRFRTAIAEAATPDNV